MVAYLGGSAGDVYFLGSLVAYFRESVVGYLRFSAFEGFHVSLEG